VAVTKSISVATGRGEIDTDFSFFGSSSSTNDLFDFNGENLMWNTGRFDSENQTSAKIFHPSCYPVLRGESPANNVKMEFISELKDLENYSSLSTLAQYNILIQRIDVLVDGLARTRQTSAFASETPLTLIAGSPSQNDQGIYDVNVTLSSSGNMLPFTLIRVASPGACIGDDLKSSEQTQLLTIPSQSSYSFLLSNVIAGNWAVLLNSTDGMRNQTYTISASATLKSSDRSGWNCGQYGYCTLSSNTRSISASEGSTFNNPTVIGDDRSPAAQITFGFILTTMLAFLSWS